MGFRGDDYFRTDPTGRIAAGPPSGGGGNMGPSIGVGGISPAQMPSPVQQAGSGAPMPRAPGGLGATFSVPIGGSGSGSTGAGNQPFKQKNENVQKKAKGGKVEGGKADMAQDKALIKKAFRQHDAQEHKGGKGTKLSLAKGGKPKKMAKGGSVSSASKRADGCATKGKTKGRFV